MGTVFGHQKSAMVGSLVWGNKWDEHKKIERKWCIGLRWPWFKNLIQRVWWGGLAREGAAGLEREGGLHPIVWGDQME